MTNDPRMEGVYQKQIKDCAKEIVSQFNKMLLLPDDCKEILQEIEQKLQKEYKGEK